MNELTLRSTSTFTLVDCDAETGAELKSVSHTARFHVTPGALHDMTPWHRSHKVMAKFRPTWLEARWVNGWLTAVDISGPKVMRNGQTDDRAIRELRWRPCTFALDYVVVTLLLEYQRENLSVPDVRVSA